MLALSLPVQTAFYANIILKKGIIGDTGSSADGAAKAGAGTKVA